METINIALATPVKQFIDEQVASGAYPDASEYIQHLIRADQERRVAHQTFRLTGRPSIPRGRIRRIPINTRNGTACLMADGR